MSTKPQPNLLIKLFPLLGEKSVNLRTELLAGLTTFLTMAYIIAINPSILSEAGMDSTHSSPTALCSLMTSHGRSR